MSRSVPYSVAPEPVARYAARGDGATAARQAPARPAIRRPPLRVVEDPARRSRRGRKRAAPAIISLALLVGSLLAVVIGHAMLAAGDVRLSAQQAQLVAEEAQHRTMELATAQLQIPARIVAKAEQALHMVLPSQVTQIPAVPLNTPEPPPKIYAAPRATPTTVPATTTTTSSTTTTTTTVP
jgi:hypothetical protein